MRARFFSRLHQDCMMKAEIKLKSTKVLHFGQRINDLSRSCFVMLYIQFVSICPIQGIKMQIKSVLRNEVWSCVDQYFVLKCSEMIYKSAASLCCCCMRLISTCYPGSATARNCSYNLKETSLDTQESSQTWKHNGKNPWKQSMETLSSELQQNDTLTKLTTGDLPSSPELLLVHQQFGLDQSSLRHEKRPWPSAHLKPSSPWHLCISSTLDNLKNTETKGGKRHKQKENSNTRI